MVLFGSDITLFNFVWFLAHNLDQILVGRLFGATQLGLYRQGINLVLAPINQLYYPVNNVAETALSKLQTAPDRYRRYYVLLLGSMSMITMPLVAFLATFAEEVVRVALGPNWIAAAEYFRILAIAAFIKPASQTAGFVMTTSGKSRRYLWWGMLTAISLVGCLLVGAAVGSFRHCVRARGGSLRDTCSASILRIQGHARWAQGFWRRHNPSDDREHDHGGGARICGNRRSRSIVRPSYWQSAPWLPFPHT